MTSASTPTVERTEQRLRALVNLARAAWAEPREGSPDLAPILEAAAAVLEVERVSFWRLNADQHALRCQHLFLAREGRHLRAGGPTHGDGTNAPRAQRACGDNPAPARIVEPDTHDLLTGPEPRRAGERRRPHRDPGVGKTEDERDREQRVILPPETHGASRSENPRAKGMKTREAGRETGPEEQHEEGDRARPHGRPGFRARASWPGRSAASWQRGGCPR